MNYLLIFWYKINNIYLHCKSWSKFQNFAHRMLNSTAEQTLVQWHHTADLRPFVENLMCCWTRIAVKKWRPNTILDRNLFAAFTNLRTPLAQTLRACISNENFFCTAGAAAGELTLKSRCQIYYNMAVTRFKFLSTFSSNKNHLLILLL